MDRRVIGLQFDAVSDLWRVTAASQGGSTESFLARHVISSAPMRDLAFMPDRSRMRRQLDIEKAGRAGSQLVKRARLRLAHSTTIDARRSVGSPGPRWMLGCRSAG